jgi:O-antigen ligase
MINLKQKIKSIDLRSTINCFIIIYAFFAPISKAGTVFSGVLLILLWLIQGDFKSKISMLKTNEFIIVLGLFLLLSLLSVFWSSDSSYYADYMRKYWHLLMIPIIYTSLQEKYIKHIFSAFLLGMFISEIVSYGIFFEIWTKEGVSPHDPSPFMDHTNYSVYLAFTVFILMHRIRFEPVIKWKITYGLFMLFSMSNMLVNGGRTGQVAFFMTLVVVALLNIKYKLRAVVGSIVVGSIIFIAAYNISPVFHDRMNYTSHDIEVMVNEKDFTNSFSVRVSLWIMGINQFLDNPIIGKGIGDEAVGLETYIKKYNFTNYDDFQGKYIDYHNAFVQYAVQLGIGGFILFVLLLIMLLRLKFKSIVYRNLNITFVCLFSLLSMNGLSLHIMASMVLFSLFASVFNTISEFESPNCVEINPLNK